MNLDEFEHVVTDAFNRLPDDVAAYFDNVAITVASRPNTEQQKLAGKGLLFGLYEGVPRIARDGHDPMLPDRITLFLHPLMNVSRNREELDRNVLVTLWHEIGHHLGFDDEKLHRIEQQILRHTSPVKK